MSMEASASNNCSILVVGLNGALQKRFVIANNGDLVSGMVHRASQVQTGVGGKGQDVAIALKSLATPGVRLLQFLGSGMEGDTVYQLLQDHIGSDPIQNTTVRVTSPLRTCTSIVGSTDTTELVEPSGIIQHEEMDRLLEICQQLPMSPKAICIMGSMPPGCSATTYAEIYQKAATPSTLCVVDSVAGLSPMLRVLQSPTILKINIHELCSLAGVNVDADWTDAIPAFLTKFQPPFHLWGMALTDGKNPGHFCWLNNQQEKYDYQLYRLAIPVLTATATTKLYPIGAGDAVAAGTCAAWMALQNENDTETIIPVPCLEAIKHRASSLPMDIPEGARTLLTAFSFGLACGSASCLVEENSMFDTDTVTSLLETLDLPIRLN